MERRGDGREVPPESSAPGLGGALERWGEGDVGAREQAVATASDEELRAMVHAVDAVDNAVVTRQRPSEVSRIDVNIEFWGSSRDGVQADERDTLAP